MKVVFMGTPDFSVPALEALVAAGHEVVCVYTQPPRRAGRGKALRPGPVHARALELGLWRGAAPIHRAIMEGDAETGICIMQMDAGLDTGPVLLREATGIGPEETTGALHDRLSQMGGRMIVDVLSRLDALEPQVQPEEGVTYAHKVDKAEAEIDWSLPAVQVDRLIRGLSPFPGAWVQMGGERVKLHCCRLADVAGTPGEIRAPFTICCGEGAIEVLRAQRPGKRAMDQEAFLRGFDLPARVG